MIVPENMSISPFGTSYNLKIHVLCSFFTNYSINLRVFTIQINNVWWYNNLYSKWTLEQTQK
jgi:hypothetical protein